MKRYKKNQYGSFFKQIFEQTETMVVDKSVAIEFAKMLRRVVGNSFYIGNKNRGRKYDKPDQKRFPRK